MKKLTIFSLAASILSAHAAPEPIFDGKSLAGWKAKGAAPWTVADGILLGKSDPENSGSILWTGKKYTDFIFSCEFRYNGITDSGIFLRGEDDQIQIGISGSLKRDMTASPYISSKKGYPVEAKNIPKLLKEGEWNTMTITAKGPHYSVTLNGEHVMDYTSDTAKEKGPIGLQVHPKLDMRIEYRNITLEEL